MSFVEGFVLSCSSVKRSERSTLSLSKTTTTTTTTMTTGGAIAQPQPPFLTSSIQKSPSLSFSIERKMEGHGDMGLFGEQIDQNLLGRFKEDEYESRSGSDNVGGVSGDDHEVVTDRQPARKKKYHRHTQEQIKELETFFHECPHPDEKQRMDLSRRLGLESKQIKFWFQNRRTQMKTQLERHENMILRQENDKLRAENEMLKEGFTDPICNTCGGPLVSGHVPLEQQTLRMENARLKEELSRVSSLANKFLGRPLSSSANPIPPFSPNFNLDLAVGRNGYGDIGNLDATLSMGLEFDDGLMMPMMKPMNVVMGNEVNYDKSMIIDLSMSAMDELIKMAQTDSALWIKSMDGGKEALNYEEYVRTFPPCIGMKPSNFVTEASKECGIVISSSLSLVDAFMDVKQYAEMFPGLIAGASTVDVLTTGMSGSKNGCLQVMFAEFQVISPLVPVRQVKFLRYCKKHAEGIWAMADVSIDGNQAACRRLPSGCILHDMPNGCCKVTWVEHSEYDEGAVHQLFRPVLSSGRGFGAKRWIATLQRYCESVAILVSSPVSDDPNAISLAGKKSMLKLSQRMVDSFCSGVCPSSARMWDKLLVGNVAEDVKLLTRKSINGAGEPAGIVLSASTTIYLPIPRQRLFEFLSDERARTEWDILSNGGLMQEMVHIAKSQARGNHVSLLRSNTMQNDSTMLILQEIWNDAAGSLLVYAPVDVPSMSMVMNGGESNYTALLPSGFVILPDDSFDQHRMNYEPMLKNEGDGGEGSGSLLTISFQILVNNIPTAKLTVESVETVNSLISCAIQRIKLHFK